MSNSTTAPNDSSTFVLPVECIGENLKGELAGLKLYNRVLTAVEIAELSPVDPSVPTNVALNKTATASSTFPGKPWTPDKAVDGIVDDTTTKDSRWSSLRTGPVSGNAEEYGETEQWLKIDLEAPYILSKITVFWEGAFATHYKLMGSLDDENYFEIKDVDNVAAAGLHTHDELETQPVRYLKIDCLTPKTARYGYSIFEVEAYGVPVKYTVTFETNGGSSIEDATVESGAVVTRPTDPTKSGFAFDGWFIDENLTEAYDFETPVSANITLYAKWAAVDKSTLPDAIAAANTAKEGVEASDKSAGEVEKDTKFVTTAEMTALNAAIADAQAILDKANAPQSEVDSAVNALNTAVDTFKAVIQTGTYEQSSLPIVVPATPPTTTETKDNEDGTTTTTVTDNQTGTVTATTEKEDGTVEIVETKKDGTVTETTEKPDGSSEVVETKPDGTVTETTTDPEGGKVEKVTTPDEDVTITVTNPDGEELAKVEIPAEIPALDADKTFIDVREGYFAEEAINNMAALGVVNGKGDRIFDPKSPMKRSELAKVLYELANGKEGYTTDFTDVPSTKWYADSVAWAVKAGVVKGVSDTEFEPERTITREELAAMLCRYARMLGMDTTAQTSELDVFSDGATTHAWAASDMAWCGWLRRR